MRRPTLVITATALASIGALSLAGAAHASAASATLAGLSAAAATAAAPPVSGQGKAGKRAAKQRDFKGVKSHKRSNAHKRSKSHSKKVVHKSGRRKTVHKTINKTVHKTVVKPRHTTIAHSPRHSVHAGSRHHVGARHGVRRHRSGLHVGVGIGSSVHIGGSFGFSSGHHRARTHHYSPHYSYRYRPHYSYGGSRHHSYGYSYSPHYSYGYRYSPHYSSGSKHTYSPRRSYVYASPAPYDDSRIISDRDASPAPIVVQTPPAQMTYPAPALSEGQAWNLLAAGEHAAAQSAFAQAASAHPSSAPPKVGYALAAALRGDASTAAWAFRRVFRMAPDGADRAPIDARLRQSIEGLMYRYQDQAANSTGAQAIDAWFLTAATSHILGDRQAAADAIHRAIEAGDRSVEARNLRSLVESVYEGAAAENAVARR